MVAGETCAEWAAGVSPGRAVPESGDMQPLTAAVSSRRSSPGCSMAARSSSPFVFLLRDRRGCSSRNRCALLRYFPTRDLLPLSDLLGCLSRDLLRVLLRGRDLLRGEADRPKGWWDPAFLERLSRGPLRDLLRELLDFGLSSPDELLSFEGPSLGGRGV